MDPKGPEKGPFRVLRGGSWFRYAKYARSSYRKFFHPDGDGDATTAYITDFGCRLVINLPDPPTKAGLDKAPLDRKSTRLNSSHSAKSRMPSSA